MPATSDCSHAWSSCGTPSGGAGVPERATTTPFSMSTSIDEVASAPAGLSRRYSAATSTSAASTAEPPPMLRLSGAASRSRCPPSSATTVERTTVPGASLVASSRSSSLAQAEPLPPRCNWTDPRSPGMNDAGALDDRTIGPTQTGQRSSRQTTLRRAGDAVRETSHRRVRRGGQQASLDGLPRAPAGLVANMDSPAPPWATTAGAATPISEAATTTAATRRGLVIT